MCQKLGIQLFCGYGDVSRYANEHSLGTEEAARILRYEFLLRKPLVDVLKEVFGADAEIVFHNPKFCVILNNKQSF